MKKILVMLLLSLFLISLISVALVSAETCSSLGYSICDEGRCPSGYGAAGTFTDVSAGKICCASACTSLLEGSRLCSYFGWKQTNWICPRLAVWEPGIDWTGDLTGTAIFFKYMMLLLVVILIYSGLSYAKFPESSILQVIIAIVAGFVITFMISTEEILTSMTSFSALGITLIIFFPIMILGFFTLVVASKASPAGIFVQRIMWVIYSVFLFIKAGSLALGKYYAQAPVTENGIFSSLIKFFIGDANAAKYASVDNTVLVVLFVTAIAVFIIMVLKGDAVEAWLGKEEREAELEGKKAEFERSKNFTKLTAQQMEKQ